jgi:hypothetical protein
MRSRISAHNAAVPAMHLALERRAESAVCSRVTCTGNDGDGALLDRADLRALSASLDLFGCQKQKRERMSYIAANAGPRPATSACMHRHRLRRDTSRRSNCSQAV